MTIEDYIVTEDSTLLETIDVINRNSSKTAFLCREKKLLAAVSDGDIGRAILKGLGTDVKVKEIANYNPVSLPVSRKSEADEMIKEKQINAIPLLDEAGEIVDIKILLKGGINRERNLDIPVVIMAGGKGTRLKPFTDILPKPLIPIGDKTITEHIMDHFSEFGCNRVHMIVNYKKEFIKAYFTDNPDKAGDIIPAFIDEKEYLGTGGGLSLLTGLFDSAFFMTNCDIIINADYESIFNKHREDDNIITMVCARKSVTIPYGTIEVDSLGQVKNLKEKPVYNMITNTGFYVIEPRFLEQIPHNTRIDITDVIEECIKKGDKVGAFLIDEDDWMDMGQLEELEKMREKLGIK